MLFYCKDKQESVFGKQIETFSSGVGEAPLGFPARLPRSAAPPRAAEAYFRRNATGRLFHSSTVILALSFFNSHFSKNCNSEKNWQIFRRLVRGCIEPRSVNSRWKALDEIYKIYMLLHRSDFKISVKNRQHFFTNEK